MFQTKSAHVETGSLSQLMNRLKAIQLWHRGTIWLFQMKVSAPLNLKLTQCSTQFNMSKLLFAQTLNMIKELNTFVLV